MPQRALRFNRQPDSGLALSRRLVGPGAAVVENQLVGTLFERDRLEQFVIDKHDHDSQRSIASSGSITRSGQ